MADLQKKLELLNREMGKYLNGASGRFNLFGETVLNIYYNDRDEHLVVHMDKIPEAFPVQFRDRDSQYFPKEAYFQLNGIEYIELLTMNQYERRVS